MKGSSVILLVTFVLLLMAMFVSNFLIKQEYNNIDKSDIYWTYGKILQQPFKHLNIEGGNITNIAFEQSKKPSVRVLKNWQGYENKVVKTYVKNDTLFVKFPNTIKDPNERQYVRRITLVRIFAPELLSVNGFDTNFGLFKLKQRSIKINLSGRSNLEVQSYLHNFDSLHITQRDSSKCVFEMSPDLKGTEAAISQSASKGTVSIQAESGGLDIQKTLADHDVKSNSWETMYIKTVDANVQGLSLLDLGHAQVHSLNLSITDTSAIILSGGSLRKFKR
ncbi:MAG: hypothetical protein WKF97_21905 [Chitinophagaceae bacterium]